MSGYNNTEVVLQKGGKIVRKVTIKNGKGYKSITKFRKGKKMFTIKKPIHKEHIKLIKKGKFIPGLFNDCKNCKTKKLRGGNDEEMGPDIPEVQPYPIPPDPERFKQYEKEMRMRPSSPDEVEKVFAGPNPEEKQHIEGKKMADEDPLNMDPYQREELKIFRGGKTRRRKIRKGGDANIQQLDNQRQNMLYQLRELMTQNQQNMQRYQQLDDRLYDIEQMSQEERASHMNEENDLQRQMAEITNLNNQLQIRFEQMRTDYFQRYGTPVLQ